MHKITITTKRKAMAQSIETLFTPGGTATTVEKFDRGKYRVDMEYIGREVETYDSILAIWPERRKDKDGPYIQLMCVCYERCGCPIDYKQEHLIGCKNMPFGWGEDK